jgi:hypothetical protein
VPRGGIQDFLLLCLHFNILRITHLRVVLNDLPPGSYSAGPLTAREILGLVDLVCLLDLSELALVHRQFRLEQYGMRVGI